MPDGQIVDIHNRRLVYKDIRDKAVLEELFDTIAPLVEDRNGGYTRIVKTGFRRGDGGNTAIIELVDWSAPQDGAIALKGKKRSAPKKDKPKEEEIVEDFEENIEDVEESDVEYTETEETPAEEEAKADEPAEETPAEEEAKAEEPAEETPAEEEAKAEEPAEKTPAEEEAKADDEKKDQ